MVSPSTLLGAYNLAKGAGKVLEGSVEIACTKFPLFAALQSQEVMYADAKMKSEEARAREAGRAFSQANVQGRAESDVDIFGSARLRAEAARAKHAKHAKEELQAKHVRHAQRASHAAKKGQKRQFHSSRILLDNGRSGDGDGNNVSGVKTVGQKVSPTAPLSQSPVPSSRLGRLFHYGSLAASVGAQVLADSASQYASGKTPDMRSLIMSPRNIERMAKKFSQMRGAALKVGQMLSFQDSSVLPKEIQQILLRVQNSAHYMPASQLERTISFELGDGWRGRLFASFDDIPIAAASIGQVHTAVTRKELEQVVVKVQYPGVANSIDSDLDNILTLLTASKLLPPGLFLEKSIANARVELKWECDYIREASNLVRYGEMLADEPVFRVPKVYHDLSDEHVLTMERMKGVEIVKGEWSQEIKDFIAENVMRLCLLEIYKYKFMQTDPNWANFLYNETSGQIELLDFGACRAYPDEFIKDYANCLRAAVREDREKAREYSVKLGFLTGLESPAMTEAHIDSILVLGEPFRANLANEQGIFDFNGQTITDRVRTNIKLMLNERLTPPPEETYSLHRKLSGAYLLCARLGASIKSSEIFDKVIGLEYE